MIKKLIFTSIALITMAVAIPANAAKLLPGTYKLDWVIPPPPVAEEKTQAELNTRLNSVRDFYAASKGEGEQFVGLASENALFAIDFSYGTGFVIAIDESKGTGTGYDAAYIAPVSDMKIGMDVKKAKRISLGAVASKDATASDASNHLCMLDDPAQATVDIETGPKGRRTVRQVAISRFEADIATRRCALETRGGWVGTIKTNKGTVKVSVTDDGDGVYNTTLKRPKLALWWNRGDSIDIDGGYSMPLGSIMCYQNDFYKMQLSEIGDKLTIKPYNGAMGSVKVAVKSVEGKTWECTFSSYYTEHSNLNPNPCYGIVPLPVGTYWAQGLLYQMQDGGETLTLASDAFTVKAGKTTTITAGGPIRVVLGNNKTLSVKRGTAAELPLSLKVGQAAIERYESDNSITAAISDSKGKVFWNGRPDFDQRGQTQHINIPKTLPAGKYQVAIKVDMGSYQKAFSVKRALHIK